MKPLRVELGELTAENQRWASIKLGEATVFAEVVFDTREARAETNIVNLFALRLCRLLQGDAV